MEKEKKHGVIVTPKKTNKKFAIKRIWNNGWLMRRYSYCPTELKFKNKMINDMNQHYCGGWTFSSIDNSYEYQLKRLINGEKPLLVIHWIELSKVEKFVEEIKEVDLPYKIEPRDDGKDRYNLLVCQKGDMKSLFNLDVLKEDYKNYGIHIDIEAIKNKQLSDYFAGWDVEDVEMWETGLILGYPIENTICLYYE